MSKKQKLKTPDKKHQSKKHQINKKHGLDDNMKENKKQGRGNKVHKKQTCQKEKVKTPNKKHQSNKQ